MPHLSVIELCKMSVLQVARHLAKLFDSMAALKFVEDANGPTKVAKGMYSKDKEYVDFDENCECVGQVSEISVKTGEIKLVL